jgi:hypothetical protein
MNPPLIYQLRENGIYAVRPDGSWECILKPVPPHEHLRVEGNTSIDLGTQGPWFKLLNTQAKPPDGTL